MIAIFGALQLDGLWALASQGSGVDGSADGSLDLALQNLNM